MTPSAAIDAATTPLCAAQPQWTRFTVPPVRLASMTPEPIEAAIPMAWATPSASSPRRSAAAAAAPTVPQIEVAWNPFSKKTELRTLGT